MTRFHVSLVVIRDNDEAEEVDIFIYAKDILAAVKAGLEGQHGEVVAFSVANMAHVKLETELEDIS